MSLIGRVYPGFYRHFKGGWYLVIGVFTHTETGERFVAYVGRSGFWVRPEDDFTDAHAQYGQRFYKLF